MKVKALIHYDTPNDGMATIRLPKATFSEIAAALHSASNGGGRYLKVHLFRSGIEVFSARARQAPASSQEH